MTFTLKDAVDSIQTLVDHCGVELDVYAWQIIKEHLVEDLKSCASCQEYSKGQCKECDN